MSRLVTDHLPLLAGAPNGVKKLRELILELAVRGKLVAQDSSDEPAIELLKRITTEKTRLAGDKKAKTRVSDAPSLMDLPNGWISTTLAEVAFINPRNKVDDALEVSFVPMALIGTSFKGAHSQESRAWHEVKQGFTHFAEGDVGIAKITPCFENSKACVFSGLKNNFGAGTTELHIVRPIAGLLNARYILAYIKSPQFLLIGETRMTGTAGQKRLPKDFVENNPFPLPPLAEQARIVAKVDELMALCDRLETRQSDAQAAHARLVDELLGSLLQARDAKDFAECWGRVKGSFDVLFTTEQSIDDLKRMFLSLAVTGKLSSSKELGNIGWYTGPFNDLIDPLFPIAYGVLVPGPETAGGIPFVRIADLSISSASAQPEKTISPDVDAKFSRTRLRGGEILMGVVGSIGKLGVAPDSWAGANIARAICRIVPNTRVCKAYMLWLLQSDVMQKQFIGDTRTLAQPTLNVGMIRSAVVSIPPLAEQYRIVAKIDEFMALCDRIKAKMARARELNERLAGALVERATP